MEIVKKIAWWLMVIGGINWGLVGLGMLMGGEWNVVKLLLGSWSTVEALVYLLVGVSTAWTAFAGCKDCCKAPAAPTQM